MPLLLRNSEQGKFLYALVVTILFFGIVLASLQTRYNTNDDVVMHLLADGHIFSNLPTEHLGLMHFFLGRTLKTLYQWQPFFPFYGVMLYSFYGLALTFYAYSLSRLGLGYSLVGGWLIVAGGWGLLTIQFTIVAFLLAGTGVFLWFSLSVHPASLSGMARRRLRLAASGLIVLGSMVRFESAMAAMLCGVPPVLFLFWVQGRTFPEIVRLILPVLLAGFAAVVLHGIDRNHYAHTAGWEHFAEGVDAIHKLIDNKQVSYTPQTADVFAQAGWTENDAAAFSHWIFSNNPQFSEEKLTFITNRIPAVQPRKTDEYIAVFIWITIMFYPLCLRFNDVSPIGKKTTIVHLLWIGTVLLLITIFYRFPPWRLFYPFTVAYFTTYVGIVAFFYPKQLRQKELLFLFSLCALGTGYALVASSQSIGHMQKAYSHDLAELLRMDSQAILAPWGGVFPFEYLVHPLKSGSNFSDMKLLVTGNWATFTPTFQESAKERTGIKDSFKALCDDHTYSVISPEDIPILVRYLEEHYHYKAKAKLTFRGTDARTDFYRIECTLP